MSPNFVGGGNDIILNSQSAQNGHTNAWEHHRFREICVHTERQTDTYI